MPGLNTPTGNPAPSVLTSTSAAALVKVYVFGHCEKTLSKYYLFNLCYNIIAIIHIFIKVHTN